jgi:hypothetical protein
VCGDVIMFKVMATLRGAATTTLGGVAVSILVAVVKKSVHSYLLYLLTSYILAKRVEYKDDTFASMSSEFYVPGGLYFGYSVFPGVMLASSMHTPESLLPDLQQLLLALVL